MNEMSEATIAEIFKLADRLSFSDRLSLIERLAGRMQQKVSSKQARSLRGIWKDKVPADFDIDGALRQIRGEQNEAGN
jgi:hypothetical protein